MSVLALFLLIALVGFLAWLLPKLIPMPPEIQKVLVGVAVVIVILLVLQAFGLLGGVGSIQVPRIR